MTKTIFTTKEAAELLNVTQRTIQLWADSGILVVGKTPGGHRRIKAESVYQLREQMDNDSSTETEPLTQDRKHILIVDDDPAIQKLLKINIQKWQLPVDITMVSDGYEALLYLGHHKPEILITDLGMPRIDGFHMLKILSESALLRNTAICIITGLSSEVIEDKGGLDKEVVILGKPIDFKSLKIFIQGCLK